MRLTNIFHFWSKGRLPPTSYMARVANNMQTMGVFGVVLLIPACYILKTEADRQDTREFYKEQYERRKGQDKLGIFKGENKFGLIQEITPAKPKTEADKREEFENYVNSLELPKPTITGDAHKQ